MIFKHSGIGVGEMLVNAGTEHVTQEAAGRGREESAFQRDTGGLWWSWDLVGALSYLPLPSGWGPLKGPLVGSRSPVFESNLETFSFLLCEEEGKQG